MKKLLGILVMGLFLITPSQADDIRDFEIEGISVGQSLLDYLSKEEIVRKKKADYKMSIILGNGKEGIVYILEKRGREYAV